MNAQAVPFEPAASYTAPSIGLDMWRQLKRVEIPTFSGEKKNSEVVSVSCFGVIVSVMFHFMFVHYTFSSVWVAEWPPFEI